MDEVLLIPCRPVQDAPDLQADTYRIVHDAAGIAVAVKAACLEPQMQMLGETRTDAKEPVLVLDFPGRRRQFDFGSKNRPGHGRKVVAFEEILYFLILRLI